jgi:hypothetical protein
MGEEVMNRRSFFKFLPVAPVVLVAEGARASNTDQAPNDSIIPLQITGHKRHDPKPGWFTHPEIDPTRQVSMAVGQDGRLWLKSKNDVWKRVVTE